VKVLDDELPVLHECPRNVYLTTDPPEPGQSPRDGTDPGFTGFPYASHKWMHPTASDNVGFLWTSVQRSSDDSSAWPCTSKCTRGVSDDRACRKGCEPALGTNNKIVDVAGYKRDEALGWKGAASRSGENGKYFHFPLGTTTVTYVVTDKDAKITTAHHGSQGYYADASDTTQPAIEDGQTIQTGQPNEIHDASTRTVKCDFTITVVDEEPPVIHDCPADVVLTTDTSAAGLCDPSEGCRFATHTWKHPYATDNVGYKWQAVRRDRNETCSESDKLIHPTKVCNALESIAPPTGGEKLNADIGGGYSGPQDVTSVFDLGVTRVYYEVHADASIWTTNDAEDNRWNDAKYFSNKVHHTASCSFKVTVLDSINPEITSCPKDAATGKDFFYTTEADKRTRAVSWDHPSASDNVGVMFLPVRRDRNESAYPLDDATPADTNGVNKLDCYGSDDVACRTFMHNLDFQLSSLNNKDNEAALAKTDKTVPYSTFDLGVTTVTYEVWSDARMQLGEGKDTAGSLLHTKIGGAVYVESEQCKNSGRFEDCMARPGPIEAALVTEQTAGFLPSITHKVSCSFTVTVVDDQPPQIVRADPWKPEDTKIANNLISHSPETAGSVQKCPPDVVVGTDTGSRGAAVTWHNPTATDNVGFRWQRIRRTRNETDSGAIIDVPDLTGVHGLDEDLLKSQTSLFDLGETTVQYVVRGDVQKYLLNKGSKKGCAGPNCGDPGSTLASPAPKTTISDPPFAAGDQIEHYDHCSFTVKVLDDEAPRISWGDKADTEVSTAATCPDDIVQYTDPSPRILDSTVDLRGNPNLMAKSDADTGYPYATVKWVHPKASDNVGFVWHRVERDRDCSRQCVYKSDTGNPGSSMDCYQSVKESWQCDGPKAGDNSVAADGIYLTRSGSYGYDKKDGAGNAINLNADLAGFTPAYKDLPSNRDPMFQFELGETVVKYRVADAPYFGETKFSSGDARTAECTFKVTVIDAENPVIHDCPPDVVTITDPDPAKNQTGKRYGTISWTHPYATDNVGFRWSAVRRDRNETSEKAGYSLGGADKVYDQNKALDDSYSKNIKFDLGQTTVSYELRDDNLDTNQFAGGPVDHVARCSFTVTVLDQDNPKITNCPANVVLGTDGKSNMAKHTWTLPTATDNVGFRWREVRRSHNEGLGHLKLDDTAVQGYHPLDSPLDTIASSYFELGVTTITYEVDDLIPGQDYLSTQSYPQFDNSCDIPSCINQNCLCKDQTDCTKEAEYPPFFLAAEKHGTKPVPREYTSCSSHVTTCMFTVEVVDSENPIIHDCPENVVISTDLGERSAKYTWTHPTASDNTGFIWQAIRRDRNESEFPLDKDERISGGYENGEKDHIYEHAYGLNEKLPVGDPESTFDLGITTVSYQVVSGKTIQTHKDYRQDGDRQNKEGEEIICTGVDGPCKTYLDEQTLHLTSCSFTVTVIDSEDPKISGCPESIVQRTDPPAMKNSESTGRTKYRTAIVSWTHPTASDNVGFRWRKVRRDRGESEHPIDFDTMGNGDVSYLANSPFQNIAPLFTAGSIKSVYTLHDAASNPAFFAYGNTDTNYESKALMQADTFVADDDNGKFSVECAGVQDRTQGWDGHDGAYKCTTYHNMRGFAGEIPQDSSAFFHGLNEPLPTLSDFVESRFATTKDQSFDKNHPVSTFDLGVTTVSYEVVDTVQQYILTTFDANSGNAFTGVYLTEWDEAKMKHSAVCSFTITVLDEEDPVIHECPSNQVVGTDPQERWAEVKWTHPTASDNVGFRWRKVRRDRNETISADYQFGKVYNKAGSVQVQENQREDDNVNKFWTLDPEITVGSAQDLMNDGRLEQDIYDGIDSRGYYQFPLPASDPARFAYGTCHPDPFSDVIGLCPGEGSEYELNEYHPLDEQLRDSTSMGINGHEAGKATARFDVGVTMISYQVVDTVQQYLSMSSPSHGVVSPTFSLSGSTSANGTILSETCGGALGCPSYPENLQIESSISTTDDPRQGLRMSGQVAHRATCTFSVTVLDEVDPTIQGCPANLVQRTDLPHWIDPVTANRRKYRSAVVSWTHPTASDNIGFRWRKIRRDRNETEHAVDLIASGDVMDGRHVRLGFTEQERDKDQTRKIFEGFVYR
jgi:hypothetical protein